MNIKVAAFMAMTMAGLGYFLGITPSIGISRSLTKEGCMASVEKQMDRDLFKEIDPAGMCACLADLKLTPGTADFKTVQPCLDKNLKEPISNACEKDEAARKTLREKLLTPEEEMKQAEENPDGVPDVPEMNCECVADKSIEWVWQNFDAAMHSKKLTKDDATNSANDIVKECRWQ